MIHSWCFFGRTTGCSSFSVPDSTSGERKDAAIKMRPISFISVDNNICTSYKNHVATTIKQPNDCHAEKTCKNDNIEVQKLAEVLGEVINMRCMGFYLQRQG